VRWARHPLAPAEVRAHLGAGKLPAKLGLTWNDRVAFVLDKALAVKRVQFLDVTADDRAQGESAAEQFDIDAALATGELSQLVGELTAALGGLAAVEVRRAA
jgi:recombination associated protein RdgC